MWSVPDTDSGTGLSDTKGCWQGEHTLLRTVNPSLCWFRRWQSVCGSDVTIVCSSSYKPLAAFTRYLARC